MNDLTKPAIQRLAQKAGVLTMSGLIYDEIRDIVKVFLNKALKYAITYADHARRATLTQDDILMGLEKANAKILAHGDMGSVKTCDVYKGKPKKDRALRIAQYLQKQSDCVYFSRAGFVRLVRDISRDYIPDLRFTQEALGTIHIATEDHIISLFQDSIRCAIHAGRKELQPKDFQLARRIRGDGY